MGLLTGSIVRLDGPRLAEQSGTVRFPKGLLDHQHLRQIFRRQQPQEVAIPHHGQSAAVALLEPVEGRLQHVAGPR